MRQQFLLVDRISQFLLFNRGLAVVDHLLLHLLTALFVSEAFAVKFKSCLKSNLILNDFLTSQILRLKKRKLVIWGKAQRESARR